MQNLFLQHIVYYEIVFKHL